MSSSMYKAVSLMGGQAKSAKQLGVAQSCVWKWVHGKVKISAEKAIEIEEVTNGAVTCEELRPDVKWHVLRNKKATNSN